MYVKKCDICKKEIETVEHLALASVLEVYEGATQDTSLTTTLPLDRVDICKDCKYKLLKNDYLDRDLQRAIINGLKLETGFLVDEGNEK